MSNSRRKHSPEYKQEAIALALQSDENRSEVARNLGISSGNLHRWVNEYQTPNSKAFTGNGNPRDENSINLSVNLRKLRRNGIF